MSAEAAGAVGEGPSSAHSALGSAPGSRGKAVQHVSLSFRFVLPICSLCLKMRVSAGCFSRNCFFPPS